MKKIISVLTALLIGLNLCGCALTDWVDARMAEIFPADASDTSENQSEDKPNVINTGIYDFDTFNPLVTQSESVKEAMQLVYEPLYSLDEEMRPVPVLAKDYSKSPDGKVIVLNIKDNVLWHDETPLTAEDVAYTFKMIRLGQTGYTENLHNVADYMMIDDYTLQITLKTSAPVFEAMLTFPIIKYNTDMSVNPSYIPNGTGPFCYGTTTRVDEIYFSAFAKYRDGRAGIDSMILHMANSQDKYMTMLEASEIDFSSSHIVDLTEYMPKGSLSLYDFPENKIIYLGFNMGNRIFNGALTRRGIAELIDKDRIVNSVVFSRAFAADIPINPSSYLYYDEATSFKADELTANDSLGDDGWGPDTDGQFVRTVNGAKEELSFEILANSDSGEQTKVANDIAEQLGRLGVGARVTALPYNEYMNRIQSKNFDAFIGEQELDASMELTPLTDAGGNYFSYNNPELGTINAQMGMTSNEEELKALFRQYCETVTADMPFSVIYYKKGSLIASANVKKGIVPSYTWLYRNCSLWSTKE